MTEQHPMIPPLELLKRWEDLHFDEGENYDVMLIQAYQAGADAELEACCEWIYRILNRGLEWSMDLRSTRRPKPPSLKAQALAQVESFACSMETLGMDSDLIRRALEKLPND